MHHVGRTFCWAYISAHSYRVEGVERERLSQFELLHAWRWVYFVTLHRLPCTYTTLFQRLYNVHNVVLNLNSLTNPIEENTYFYTRTQQNKFEWKTGFKPVLNIFDADKSYLTNEKLIYLKMNFHFGVTREYHAWSTNRRTTMRVKRGFHSLLAREICADPESWNFALFPTKSAWNSTLFDVITYLFACARLKMENENHA